MVRKTWYHQQESNLYLALRRHSFYPLNYGGWQAPIVRGRYFDNNRIASSSPLMVSGYMRWLTSC